MASSATTVDYGDARGASRYRESDVWMRQVRLQPIRCPAIPDLCQRTMWVSLDCRGTQGLVEMKKRRIVKHVETTKDQHIAKKADRLFRV